MFSIVSCATTFVIDDAWTTAETRDAELRVTTDLVIDADAGRVQHLLENLFRNAVEHGGADVTVTVGDLDTATGFYVEDDGRGIPPEERDQIFESGYSTDDEGTGLGLAIVNRIADAHGWEIAVTERPRGGTRFEISDVEIVHSRASTSGR